MGCNCGKNGSPRCNLCGKQSNKFFPWGKSRNICWRCKDKMEQQVEDAKMKIDRITTLMKGENWSKMEYKKNA